MAVRARSSRGSRRWPPLEVSWSRFYLGGDPPRLEQESIGGFVVRSVRQRGRSVRAVEISVKLQPPGIDLLPGHAALADREETVAVLLDADHDDSVTQERNARQKETNEVHDVLRADLAARAEILFELLELPEDVTVVRLIDELR